MTTKLDDETVENADEIRRDDGATYRGVVEG
jgi:hypothetical protein